MLAKLPDCLLSCDRLVLAGNGQDKTKSCFYHNKLRAEPKGKLWFGKTGPGPVSIKCNALGLRQRLERKAKISHAIDSNQSSSIKNELVQDISIQRSQTKKEMSGLKDWISPQWYTLGF